MVMHGELDRTIRRFVTYRSESLLPRQPDGLYLFTEQILSVQVAAPDTVAIDGMRMLAIASFDYRIGQARRPGGSSA